MDTTNKTIKGRGCGQREEGKPYLCTGLSPEGLLVEEFIVDPVWKWDLPGHTRGYTLITKNAINHLVIFIGRQYYQSPWSFVEEVRHYGASRKIPVNFPFEKLTPGKSNMYFAHAYVLPEYTYTAMFHPNHCLYGGETKVKSWHTHKIVENQLVPQKPTHCTHYLRSLAIFHEKHTFRNGIYTIKQPSFTYNITPPIISRINDTFYNINKNFEVAYDTYPQNKLYKAPVKYSEYYGIFMRVPITHIEGCKYLPKKLCDRVKIAGYDYAVLDY